MSRALRTLLTIGSTTLFLLLSLWLAMRSPFPLRAATDDRPPTPWLPTFVCPDRITLWDDIKQLEELADTTIEVTNIRVWYLFYGATGTVIGKSPEVTLDWQGLKEDEDYNVRLLYQIDVRKKATGEIEGWQRAITYTRHTEPYCYGQIHSDYTFNERHYPIQSFSVWQGYKLTIPAGTTLEQYQSGGEINLIHAGNSAVIAGKLISATLVVSGNVAILDGARLYNNPNLNGRGLRVVEGGTVHVTGGSMSNTNITVLTGTVTLDHVQGAANGDLWPGSVLHIGDSDLQGNFYTRNFATLSVSNSTITGTVRAGSGSSPSAPLARATLISTTLLAPDGCTRALARSDPGGSVILNGFRIDTRGQSNCSAAETYSGETHLWRGEVSGNLKAAGSGLLETYEIDWSDGMLRASDSARVQVVNGRLVDINNLSIYPGARLEVADSSLSTTTLFLDGPTSALSLLRNDFTYAPDNYLLWLDHAAGAQVAIHDNCFFAPRAIWAPDLTGTLDVSHNYWNHPLGPTVPPAKVNTGGAILDYSGSGTASFVPFLADEPSYCRLWPRPAPYDAPADIGPSGGTLNAPGAQIVVPPGALAAPAVVTWSQGQSASAATLEAPQDVMLLARFGLAAVSAAPPGQPLQFQKPVSLTLFYNETLLRGAEESSLGFSRWTGAAWASLPGVVFDQAADTLQVWLPDTGSYALSGTVKTSRVYLPICQKPGR